MIITARKGDTLGDGSGAYVKIANGKVELASPSGVIDVKGNIALNDPAGGNFAFPQWTDAPPKDIQQRIKPGFSGKGEKT